MSTTVDRHDAWLVTTLGAQASALLSGEGAEPDDVPARLADLGAQASLLPEPARATLLQRVKDAGANPDETTLDALADGIAAAAKSARAAEAQREAGNTVSYRLLQKQWIAAEAAAQKELDKFLDLMLGDPEVQAHEGFADLQADVSSSAALLPDDGGKLIVALGVLDDADEATRPKALRSAMTALDTYRRDLAAADELESLQEIADEFYGGQKFFSALQASLAGLAGELTKRG